MCLWYSSFPYVYEFSSNGFLPSSFFLTYVYFFLFRVSTSCEIGVWDNFFSSQGSWRPLLTFKSRAMPKKRHWKYLRKHSPVSVPHSPPTLGYYFFKIFVKFFLISKIRKVQKINMHPSPNFKQCYPFAMFFLEFS